MAVIKVPKPTRRAFNPKRPASALLKSQIEHLEWAVRPAAARRSLEIAPPKTEADASKRIDQLTRQLLENRSHAAPPPPAAIAPAAGPTPRRASARKARKTRPAAHAKRKTHARKRRG